MFTISLAHLLGRVGRLTPHEAVAIAQLLAAAQCGVPTLENVEISSEGTATCTTGNGEASVRELAILLDTLLPPDTRVPAALRYTIARGMGAVEAPPFGSVADFSAALHRFEALGREQVVRNLLRRGVQDIHIPSPAETLLGIRPSAAEEPAAREAAAVVPEAAVPLVLAPKPPEAMEPAVMHTDRSFVDEPAAVAHDPRGRRSSRWGALAAGVALLASGAAGYAVVELRNSRNTMSRGEVQRHAPAPPVAVGEPQPAQPLGTTGREATTDGAAAGSTGKTPRSPLERVRVSRAQAGPAFSPAFSSDGRALFFQTGTRRDASSAIAMLATAIPGRQGARVTRIVDDGSRNYHAQPSPDGRYVAFDSDRHGERGVYVAKVDGSDVRRVSGPGYAAVPTWSPDGTRLTYIRAEPDRPSVWNLWIQPAHRGPARRLTNHSYGQTWSASWFPDGRRIAYAYENALIVLDLNTGRARRIGSPVKGGQVRTPAVSRDGSRIVFQVFRNGAWIWNLTDGTMERVLADRTAEEFAWAPDGRIAFHSRRDGEWAIYLLEQG